MGRPLTRKVFGSIAAQHDNLGDIAIRRVFFQKYTDEGRSLVLLCKGMPTTYIELFNFSPHVTLVPNSIAFQLKLLWEALNRRADLVYAPGPHRLDDDPKAIAKTILMLANIALIRASGGVIQTAGRALRGNGRLSWILERQIVRLSRLYVVRDSASLALMENEVLHAPDLAFGMDRTARASNHPRKLVALSFRNDTNIDLDTFERLIASLKVHNFNPVLVSQVRRDDVQHEKLATKFGLEAFLWGKKSHTDQQSVVDSVYRRSFAVISNRLHGLIFGIMAGAIPVEYRIGASDKISSTVTPWFGSYPIISDQEHAPGANTETIQSLIEDLKDFDQRVDSVRTSVDHTLAALTRVS